MRKLLAFILLCCILSGVAFAASDDSISSIDCGNGSVFVIMDDGKLVAWGDNSGGLIPAGNNHKYIKYDDRCLLMSSAKSVSVGENCVLAINNNDELFGWGNDGKMSLLCGNANGGIAKAPVKLMDNVIYAASGNEHNAAVSSDGSLYTWGRDCNGSLGIAALSGSVIRQPNKVMGNVASVYCYDNNTLAITKDGRLYGWGEDFGFNKPQLITSGTVAVSEACGKTFLLQNAKNEVRILQCELMEDGTPSITLTPVVASNVSSIVDYGYIRDDGTLWMCKDDGNNSFVPSAERVKLAQCCDMQYRAYVSLRTLHIEKSNLNSFAKDESHSVSDISVQIQPASSGIVFAIIIAACIAAIALIIIEKPKFYMQIKEEIFPQN